MKKTILLLFASFLCSFMADAQSYKWAKAIGAGHNDVVTSIAQGDSNSTFITGWFSVQTTIGGITLNSRGSNDIFVAKLDSNGNAIWAIREGGYADDRGYGIKVDANGNVYVAGQFSGTDSFGNGTSVHTSAGGTDAFIAKFNSTGTLQWAKAGGGTRNERGNAVALDANGDAYFCGYFGLGGGGGPGGGNASANFGGTTLNGRTQGEIFAAKVDASGTWKWVLGAGSAGADVATDVAVSGNNVYVVGTFRDTLIIGASLVLSSGGSDAFWLRLKDSDGSYLSSGIGASANTDGATGVTIGAAGEVYVTGGFNQAAGGGGLSNLTIGSLSATPVGSTDIFIVRLTNTLSPVWLKSFGGTGAETARGIAADMDGNIFASGTYTTSTTIGTNSFTAAGLNDCYIVAYDSSGNMEWANSAGGVLNDDCRGITAGSNVQYIAGTFNTLGGGGGGGSAAGGTATYGSITLTANDSTEIAIAKLYSCPGLSPKLSASGPTSFCQGSSGSVTLYASKGAASYQWKLNGADINGATADSLVVTAGAIYEVTMTATGGCVQPSSKVTVNVGTPVSASMSATSSQICTGDSVILTANSGNGLTFQWILNGTPFTSYVTSNFIYAKQAGDWRVVVNSYGCVDTSTTTTLTGLFAPKDSIYAAGPTVICGKDSVLLKSDTNSTWAYQWQAQVGANWNIITNAIGDSYYAKTATRYRCVIVTGNGCTVISNVVRVTSQGVAFVFLVGTGGGGGGTLCLGDSAQMQTNNQPGGQNYVYQWYLNGNAINGANARRYTAKSSGTYKVGITSNGCENFSVDTNLTFINSNAVITPSGSVQVCANDTVKLSITGADAGTSYQWYKDGNAINGATNDNINANAAGTYSCTLSLSGCNSSINRTVTLFSAPTIPHVIQNVNVLASDVAAISYQWFLGNQPIANSNSQFIYATQTGFYNVQITDANGCKSMSPLFSFQFTNNGVGSIATDHVKVYPNPNNGSFYIDLSIPEATTITVSDVAGKIIYTEQVKVLVGGHAIQLNDAANGIYFIRVQTSNHSWIEKIKVSNN
jgi:hypothetical protein